MKKTTKINAFKAFINLQSTKTQADFKKARMVQSLSYCPEEAKFTRSALEALAAQREWVEANTAFKKLPKAKRDYAEKAHKDAVELGNRAASGGGEYSGTTTIRTEWAASAHAETLTMSGDQYSRRCTYRKTDAQHLVSLSVCDIVDLLDAPDLVEWSRREGLPLIGYDAKTGACTWVVVKNKSLKVERGWVAYENGTCYHSQTSFDHAKNQLRGKLKRLKEARNANRRERLIVRLCKNAKATLQNAKELGFCDAGIRAFQSRHNIGDEASLCELVETGNPQATQLAFHLAKAIKKAKLN
jgi:hypothetical protein